MKNIKKVTSRGLISSPGALFRSPEAILMHQCMPTSKKLFFVDPCFGSILGPNARVFRYQFLDGFVEGSRGPTFEDCGPQVIPKVSQKTSQNHKFRDLFATREIYKFC